MDYVKKYKEIDFDSEEAYKQSKLALHNKKCLYDNYKNMYQKMIDMNKLFLNGEAKVELELGSGGGFFKEINKKVITSDVTAVNGVDMVVDAQKLPFEDESIDTIYAVHVLYHIPDVNRFFNELNRCLKPNGGCVIVESYWSPIAKMFYKKFHPEDFDETVKEWSFNSNGAMSSANQALSYVILKRDRKKYDEMYPELKIVYDRPFNGFSYIATGGLWLII